jgi:hypothetical protein
VHSEQYSFRAYRRRIDRYLDDRSLIAWLFDRPAAHVIDSLPCLDPRLDTRGYTAIDQPSLARPSSVVCHSRTHHPPSTMSSDQGFRIAVDEAKQGAAEGGVPIGACLVAADGTVLGRGHNMRVQKGSATIHVRSTIT